MSYETIHRCANDPAFVARVEAAAAQEGDDTPEFTAHHRLRWPVASASDVADAYEFAVNSGNENPGGDPTVITDQQILSNVQPILAEPPA